MAATLKAILLTLDSEPLTAAYSKLARSVDVDSMALCHYAKLYFTASTSRPQTWSEPAAAESESKSLGVSPKTLLTFGRTLAPGLWRDSLDALNSCYSIAVLLFTDPLSANSSACKSPWASLPGPHSSPSTPCDIQESLGSHDTGSTTPGSNAAVMQIVQDAARAGYLCLVE